MTLFQRGFTLVELSIVIIIVSLLMASGLAVGTSMVQQANYIDTQKKLEQIRQSLHDYYIVNGRLPCAARLDLLPSNASFATEVSNCTTVGVTGTYRLGSPLVRIGMVPARTLGLTDRAASDAYGNRIYYAVTESLTNASSFSGSSGAITIRDGSSMTGNTITSNAAYMLISPGADRKGAFAFANAGLTNPCAAGNLDTHNCDLTDAIFRDTAFNSGSVAAKFFDDIVDWAPQFHFMSLDTKTNTLWTSSGTDPQDIYSVGTDGNTGTTSVGIGNSNPQTKLHVTGNAGLMRLEGTDHAFIEFYPDGPATRKAYMGFGTATNDNLIIRNEIADADISLLPTGGLGSVGVGTDTPSSKLHVNGDITTNGAIWFRPQVLSPANNAYFSVFYNMFAPVNARDWRFYSEAATGNLVLRPARDDGTHLSGDTLAFWRDGTIASYPTYTNTTGNGANMYVHTNGRLYRSTSSRRFKKDIEDYEDGLNKLEQLRPVTFHSTIEGDDRLHAGFIAEEVDEAGLTEFVSYDDEGKPDGLHYGHMTALLAKAMQEMETRLSAVEADSSSTDAPSANKEEDSEIPFGLIALILASISLLLQLRRRT